MRATEHDDTLGEPPPPNSSKLPSIPRSRRRVMRLLEKRGLENEDDPLATDDPLRATLMAASVRSRIATGPDAGQPWRRLGDRVEPMEPEESDTRRKAEAPSRCVREGGMSLHADVSIPGPDRRRMERLGRYILRPPVTLDRLEAHPDGRLAYRFKTPWRDGTTHVLMERHELLERLAPLIPPPRAHQLRYHGILAPCASGRSQVVPAGGRAYTACVGAVCGQNERAIVSASNGADAHAALDLARGSGAAQRAALGKSQPASGQEGVVKSATGGEAKPTANPEPLASRSVPATRSSRTPWSELLKRVFGVDALRCPCGKTMRVLAAITHPVVAKRILECMRLPPRAPPLGPARAPNSAADPSIEDLVAADFDQTLPWDDWSQAP